MPISSSSPSVRHVSLAATFTVEPLVAGLRFWLDELGLLLALEQTPYGQLIPQLLTPSSPFNADRNVAGILLVRCQDWLRELPAEQLADGAGVAGHVQKAAQDLERALAAHRARSAAPTLVVFCPSTALFERGLQAIEDGLATALDRLQGTEVIRAESWHGPYGVDPSAIADPFREKLAHIPYRDAYFHVLATVIARRLHGRLSPVRKVVAVDCDNTLWQGVVGEVGAEGVRFDASHRALQRTLARVADEGVLVCLCSKNVEADVWQVFDSRPDFELPRMQVVAAAINWRPKSENLRALATRLNLGLDSFIFVDDNPVECAEVRASCPEVLTVEWPDDAGRAGRLLEHFWELDSRPRTREDRQRTRMYREEAQRQELRASTLTFAAFLDSLELAVDIRALEEPDLARAAQLTLRTNQFNFTTIRRDEAELRALLSDGRHEAWTVRVRDRFGDYGLVGLVITDQTDDTLSVDTFLLSCRVLGRGVEHEVARHVGRVARSRGHRAVRAEVVPSARNAPAREFIGSLGPGSGPATPERLAVELAPATLEQLAFHPSGDIDASTEAPDADAPAPATAAEHVRAREAQIPRIAFELATLDQLAAAIGGPGAAGASDGGREASGSESTAAFVYAAFSRIMALPVETVRETDSLEGLGCSSLQIVSVTAALAERYPEVPATLLFEHRTVSDIIRRIELLDVPPQAGARVSTGTSSGGPPATGSSTGAIAVTGIDVRCAGADSLEELWALLTRGGVAVEPVQPSRRYFFGRLEDDRPHWAGLVDDVDAFDAEFFGIAPREAETMDPQLRLFLEVAWGALEDAASLGRDHDPDTGVYVGVMYGDYAFRANLLARDRGSRYRSWEGFSLANRLSQVLGFHGPSLAVDTACSSSGTALHLACQALRQQECRLAVVGGVNLILDPDRFVQLGRLGILSTSGRCVAFGAEADGTVLGEGAGAVVLRRLDDAMRRGDRIYGVILGSALSTGSGTVGFTAPNPVAQAEAIRRALRSAGVDPRTVGYVETHGTGTALGDPIEVRGLTMAYGDPTVQDAEIEGRPICRLGSIKPNVGHLEAGAGVLGLIKLMLQLLHSERVPSVSSPELNPHVPFAGSPFALQRSLEPWQRPVLQVRGRPTTVPRRAGLNSFGVGGANVHLIAQEAPPATAVAPSAERSRHLLVLSARDRGQLARRASGLAAHLRAHPDHSTADVCFTLNTGRQHFRSRAAIVIGDRNALVERLAALSNPGEVGQMPDTFVGEVRPAGILAWLFSGQGCQYAGMGRRLYETSPTFRRALDEQAEILSNWLDRPLLSLVLAEAGTDEAAALDETAYTQPALFAIEVALARLWQSWGVTPDFLLGHSVGELAAMCVAGGLGLEDGLRLVAARGRLMQNLPRDGDMVSVRAPEPQVVHALMGLEHAASIAAVNAPRQVVVSGEKTAVGTVVERLQRAGVQARRLTVSHAFHSPLMDPMLAEYRRVVETVAFAEPRLPVVSSVLGRPAPAEMTTADYWVRQVREAVRFAQGLDYLAGRHADTFVEIGPQPVLLGLGRQCLADDSGDRAWLPSIRPDADDWATVLSSVGELYVRGRDLDYRQLDAEYGRTRTSAPRYPFARKRYWIDGDVAVRATTPSESPAASVQRLEQQWIPLEGVGDSKPGSSEGRWILVGGARPPLDAAAACLRSLGRSCTTVVQGDAYRRRGRESVELTLGDADQISRLWSEIEAEAVLPEGIVLVVPAAISDPHLESVHDEVRRSLWLAIWLIQSVHERFGDRVACWIVTERTVGVSAPPSHPLNIVHAPLWGLGRTAALEFPSMWGGLIDVGDLHGEADLAAMAATLVGNARQTGEDQVAVRSGHRWVPRLIRSTSTPAPPLRFSTDGVVVVTGGLGALARHLLRWLAERGARHLLVTSRTEAVPDGWMALVEEMRREGVDLAVVRADVGTPQGLDTLFGHLSKTGYRLSGIAHLAGADQELPIASLRAGDLDAVLSPKVVGGWGLHERGQDQLEIFLAYSSIAAVLGSAGRGVYAAANAFLDALACERHRLGLPAASVDWGPWAGGGMASDEALARYERLGNRGLQPEAALASLDAVLAASAPHQVVADVAWARFRPLYEARRARPLVSTVDETGAATTPRRVRAAAQMPEWSSALATLPEDERLAALEGWMRQAAADVLGYEDAAALSSDTSLFDLGMDSLSVADFAQRLDTRLGVRSSAVIFEQPRLAELARALLPRVALPPGGSDGPGISGGSRAGSLTVPSGTPPWAGRLTGLPMVNRHGALVDLLRREVALTLGFDDQSAPRPDVSLFDIGLDSLTAAEMASRLQRQLGVRAGSLIFEHPTIEALAGALLERLQITPADTAEQSRASPLIRYVPSLEGAVAAFLSAAFPSRPATLALERWRWMFEASASRLGEPTRVWLYRDGDRVVGHHGAIPVRLKVGAESLAASWLVETMVLEPYRAQAVGSRLLAWSHDEVPLALSLGQTAEMRQIQLHLGWHQVAPLQTAQLLVRPERVLEGKLPGAAARTAGWALRASTALRGIWRADSSYETREAASFGSVHDALWARVREGLRCTVERDASYLNWKYVEQPGQTFLRLELLRSTDLVGVAVLALRPPEGPYRYCRALLVDLVSPLDDPAVTAALVRSACRIAAERGADAVNCLHTDRRLTGVLKRCGFLLRRPSRFLLVLADDATAPLLPAMTAPDAWFVTQGDSDIDRPAGARAPSDVGNLSAS